MAKRKKGGKIPLPILEKRLISLSKTVASRRHAAGSGGKKKKKRKK